MPSCQQEMLKACATGDIEIFEELLRAAADVSTPTAGGEPILHARHQAIEELLQTAVNHNQPESLKFLLRVYPSINVNEDMLLGCRYGNPDLPTLRVLHSHDPSIVSHCFNHSDGLEFLLVDYCREGNLPLAAFLLDNGADPNLEPMRMMNTCPLQVAINSCQSAALITMLIDYGAKVRVYEVNDAIRTQRIDILELLFSNCYWRTFGYSPRKNMSNLLQTARETENLEVVALVQNQIKKEKGKMSYRQFWT